MATTEKVSLCELVCVLVCVGTSLQCAPVCEYDKYDGVILESVPLLLWGCQRDRRAGCGRETKPSVTLCVCVCMHVWEYKLAVFTWQKFISILWSGEYQCLKKTHRGKASWLCVRLCVRGRGKRKTKTEKEKTINNFFITEVSLCLHLLLILPSSLFCSLISPSAFLSLLVS